MKRKPWGGRFEGETDRGVEAFTESVSFDHRLAKYDIQGSLAHAEMLAKTGILPTEEAIQIVAGLREIASEIETGQFHFEASLEDVHMNIEARLIEKIGEVGGKLHTARSRNDQVALDLRLYLREEIGIIQALLHALQSALLTLAEKNLDVILPGYTHTQRAQPVLLAHHFLAYGEMLARDEERLGGCRKRANVLPLGAGALAGTTFPIDPYYVAKLLHFPQVAANSLDAVSDRDFVLEFLGAASILMVHLSRLAEEIVLWSTAEFGFLEVSDAFATGSSMLPQKKNPDVAELVRGKTGRVFGSLMSLLTTMKGLPLSYHRDLQEDKEPLFDAVDTVKSCLEVLSQLIPEITVRRERMRSAAREGFLNATDLADYLARAGLPFRSAHQVVGQIVRYCLETQKGSLEDLSLDELRRFSPLFGPDAFAFLSLEACVDRRTSPGGTARERVEEALHEAKERMHASEAEKGESEI